MQMQCGSPFHQLRQKDNVFGPVHSAVCCQMEGCWMLLIRCQLPECRVSIATHSKQANTCIFQIHVISRPGNKKFSTWGHFQGICGKVALVYSIFHKQLNSHQGHLRIYWGLLAQCPLLISRPGNKINDLAVTTDKHL